MKILRNIAIAIVGLIMAASAAQADNAPPGSYQRSCTGINADWHRLTATCRTRNGSWSYTALDDYRRCETDIVNDNGRLQCADDDQQDDRDHHDQAPRGSYQRTCRNIETDGRSLTAECQDGRGRWRYTEFDEYRRCRADIANVNGMLQCKTDNEDDGDEDGNIDLPRGNWRSSCQNYRVYGSTLYAECRTRYGRYVQSSIDFRKCGREVSNDDGRLVCGYGDNGNHQGWGRITIFKHSKFDGKSRTYSNDVPDLNADGFGNLASSAVVQGGVWQFCDQPYYRGNCIVLDRSQANFAQIGFNDMAESLRRIR